MRLLEVNHYDICVIGSGPGGQKAAIQAAKLGGKVCVIEKMESVGGVAIHTGTIPSKALREAVFRHTQGVDHLAARGEVHEGKIDIKNLIMSTQQIISKGIDVVRCQMERNGVILITGSAKFIDEKSVEVKSHTDTQRIYADTFIIAVGTAPRKPDNLPFDEKVVFTSDDLIKLKRIPHSMTVFGGGVIGTEYASMFARLGVRVTIVDRNKRLMQFLDQQISEALQYQLRNMGITLRFEEEIERVDIKENKPYTTVDTVLKCGTVLHSDCFLYCGGRTGAVDDLNLAVVGLEADDRGRIKVDENYQSSNPNIYAIGDVIGFPSLASTSMDQGRVAACKIFGKNTTSSPQLFPYGIYSIPEISMVGSNEEQLTQQGIPYETGVANYREIARGQLIDDEIGLLKLLIHQHSYKILGVHIMGTGATELIHIGQAVMALGASVDYFLDTAFNYPTLAECYKVAALNGVNKLRQ